MLAPFILTKLLLLATAFAASQGGAKSSSRSLAQADGPGITNKPLSSTPADLLGDPSGRAHLLARTSRSLSLLGVLLPSFVAVY
jgi:hypothetical protein